MRLVAFALGVAFTALATPSAAQQRSGIGVAAGVARYSVEGTGLSMTGWWTLQRRWLTLTAVPVDMIITPPREDSRYYRDAWEGGSACRDSDTGQFADDSLCGPEIGIGASGEVGVTVPISAHRSIGIGAGVRIGDTSGPYGTATVNFGPAERPRWQLRLRAGPGITDVAAGGFLPLAR